MTPEGALNGGSCVRLTNLTSPGFNRTGGVTFSRFSGDTYAYVADGTNRLWQCLMTPSGGISGDQCNQLTNNQSPNFLSTVIVSF